MPNVKTAVSIEEPLFEKAETLAEQMNVSRSRLYSLALELLIKKMENQQALEQLNRVYADNPQTEEEKRLLQTMRHEHRRLLEESW